MYIEYKGDRSGFVWKYDGKAFENDIIIVDEGMQAVLVSDEAEMLGQGEHTVSKQSDVYYVLDGAELEADWQTDSPIIKDKDRYAICGELAVAVGDAKKLVQAIASAGSLEKLLSAIFSNELVELLQAAVNEGCELSNTALAAAAKTALDGRLEPLGIKVTSFTVTSAIKEKKSYKKLAIGIGIASAVIAACMAITVSVIIPSVKYAQATKAIDNKDYITAYDTLKELGSFRDSREKLAEIEIPVIKQQLKAKSVGDLVVIGEFEQDNELSKPEPLEWRVLAKEDNKILVITEYAIMGMPYNTERVEVSWQDCSLRTWINGEFAETALTEQIRSMILTTVNLTNTHNGSIEGRDDLYKTEDKLFLLSMDEAYAYFPVYADRPANNTDYAVACGAYRDESLNLCWWWTRSPGDERSKAAFVDTEGYIGLYGESVRNKKLSVRPAMWLSLE